MKVSCLNRVLVAALILAHALLISCDKNPTTPEQKAPELPPASSMNLDLSAFKTAAHLGKTGGGERAIGLNFVTAFAVVTIINASVTLILSVPAYVFAAAMQQQPVLDPSDGKFHWIYSVTDSNGNTLRADLAGWVDPAGLESRWEMRITATGSNPPLNNFLWFEGRAKLDNSSGNWDFYDGEQPAIPTKALHLEWQIPSATIARLQFTVTDPDSPGNGDQLTYRADGDLRWVTHYDQSESKLVEISWNEVSHAGYIIAPGYNNGQKSCWDVVLNDVVCP